jgi:signal peptidase
MSPKPLALAVKVLTGLLLVVVVGALAVLTVVPRAVGGAALTVLTGSMTPEIPVGSVVVVQPVDPGTLQVGDVVTYQKTPGADDYVTHRITDVHDDTEPVTLTTKGDANRGADVDPVPVTAVRGKVILTVPHLGTVRNALDVRGTGSLLLVLGLLGYAGLQLVAAVRERHRGASTRERSTGPGRRPAVSEPGTAPGPPAAEQLHLQTLTAMLPLSRFPGLTPSLVAQLLRVDLVDEGPDAFTIAAVREPDQIAVLEELLTDFSPVHLIRSARHRPPPLPAVRR